MSAEQANKEYERRMRQHEEHGDYANQLYENMIIAQEIVWQRKTEDVERLFYDYCSGLAGAFIADAIKNVDFSEFRSKIRKIIDMIASTYIPQRLAAEKQYAGAKPVKAIFCVCNDDEWHTDFFACFDYAPMDLGNDDWTANWKKGWDGPVVPYGDINVFDGTGEFSYALVRIYLEFARACFETHCPVPICIEFHDQSSILRVFPDSLYM